MESQNIAIASDHAGYNLKQYIITHISSVNWSDQGCDSLESVDYPNYSTKVTDLIINPNNNIEYGILICGSGIGMSIAANKAHPNIYATLVHDIESAALCKIHNNSNILCLGSNNLQPSQALKIVSMWLKTDFSQDSRHIQRINLINKYQAISI